MLRRDSLRLRILLCSLAAWTFAVRASTAPAQTPAAEPAARQAIATQGPPFFAALTGVDSHGRIEFRTGKELRTLAMAELVAWGAPGEQLSRTQVLLADGGVLAAEILSSDEDRLKVDSELFGMLEIPLELVAGAIYHPPVDARRRALLVARLRADARGERTEDGAEIRPGAPRVNSDRLILENGDELSGAIAAIGENKLQLKTPGGPVEIELDRVVAISFNPSLLSQARPRGVYCLIGFSDGSRLAAAELALDESLARVTLAGGLKLWTEASAVTFLQAFGGKAEYLSDLAAESYRHVPYLSLARPFERDVSIGGANLRAGGRTYLKGVAMHSAARLTFRLAAKHRRFEAEAAIDDETDGRGSVVFRVFVDDREAYKSPVIRGGMPPTPISVDVRGGKRLSLIVDFAERGDELDHADWLNARLVE